MTVTTFRHTAHTAADTGPGACAHLASPHLTAPYRPHQPHRALPCLINRPVALPSRVRVRVQFPNSAFSPTHWSGAPEWSGAGSNTGCSSRIIYGIFSYRNTPILFCLDPDYLRQRFEAFNRKGMTVSPEQTANTRPLACFRV